jgi:DNA-binding MarR family transcriptional regulator
VGDEREIVVEKPGAAVDAARLIEECGRSIDRVMALTKPQDSEWLSLDLGIGQLKAIMVLARHGRLTVGGLASALGVSEPSASLLVDKLVNRGLAVRENDPADRRRTLVFTSDQGNLLVERLRRSRRDQLAAWLGLMGERDLRALAQGLDAFAAAIEHGRSGE